MERHSGAARARNFARDPIRIPERTIMLLRNLRTPLAIFLALGLIACSDSDDDPAPGTASLQTLSGKINGPGGAGLQGATIRFEGSETTTDANGVFFLPDVGMVPVGTRFVEIDGTTATSAGSYPDLEVQVEVGLGDTDLTLPQTVTLPNLMSAASVMQMVAVDSSGETTEDIDVNNGVDGDIQLMGATGTVILIGNDPAVGAVDMNVTPVPNDEVPMPLPDGLLGSGFVTIQPGAARFSQPGGGGLDVRLPNALGLPLGTEVDIWSFDHDVGAWVNRSLETGNQGIVVATPGGTAVDASGVITEGGWHAPVVAVDPDCATTLTGRIVSAVDSGLGNVSVFTNLGQFTTTAADGTFSIPSVPAYDLSTTECTPISIDVDAVAPPVLGSSAASTVTVAAIDIVSGGTTALGDITITIPTTGCISGLVIGTSDASLADITVTGPTNITLTPNPNGTFFACELDPGSYTASYPFPGDLEATEVSFDVVANEVTTVALQAATGTGSETITVTVVRRGGGIYADHTPVDGAMVLLRGTDSGSSNGLLQMTDSNGETVFSNVSGPFDVTAVKDFASAGQFPGSIFRQASSLIDVDPPVDQIGVLLNLGGQDGPPTPTADATLSGTLTNVPLDCVVDIRVTNREFVDDEPTFFAAANGVTTNYSIPVPSGQVLDIYYGLICTTSPSGTGTVLGVAPIDTGLTGTVDIDLATGLATFDQSVTVQLSGVESPSEAFYSIGLLQIDATEQFVNSLFLDEDSALELPASLELPDFAVAPSNMFDNALEVDTSYLDGNTERSQNAQTRVDVASPTFTFVLPASSSLVSPAAPVIVDSASVSGTTFVFTAQGGANGVNLLSLRGPNFGKGDAEGGFTFIDWTIWAAPGVTSITLPPTPSAILSPGNYTAEFEAVRFDGILASFNAVFTDQVGENINDLLRDNTAIRSGTVRFDVQVEAPQ